MTEEAEAGRPGPTALAAKAFMARIDNESFLDGIRTKGRLGGWVGSRGAGCWDGRLSDAIADAAVDAVLERFREWAAQCGDVEPMIMRKVTEAEERADDWTATL